MQRTPYQDIYYYNPGPLLLNPSATTDKNTIHMTPIKQTATLSRPRPDPGTPFTEHAPGLPRTRIAANYPTYVVFTTVNSYSRMPSLQNSNPDYLLLLIFCSMIHPSSRNGGTVLKIYETIRLFQPIRELQSNATAPIFFASPNDSAVKTQGHSPARSFNAD